MPVAVKFAKDELKLTAEQLEEELAKSKSYKNRNKRRHVFLTPPEELKDLLLGIHLYHTTLPNVFDENQTPRTVKVGEHIELEHLTEEEKTKLEDEQRRAKEFRLRHLEEQKNRDPDAEPQPTVLQRIRQIHHTNGKLKSSLKKQDLLTMIQHSQDRIIRARTGISSFNGLHARTLDETIEWAVSHNRENEHTLLPKLLSLEEQVAEFAKEHKAALENFKAMRHRDPHNSDELAAFYVESFLDQQQGPGAGTTKSVSPRARSPSSPAASAHARRSSVGFSAAAASAGASFQHQGGAASASASATAGGTGLAAALGKRLEQLKDSGADRFEKAIVAPSGPQGDRGASVRPGGLSSRRRFSVKSSDSGGVGGGVGGSPLQSMIAAAAAAGRDGHAAAGTRSARSSTSPARAAAPAAAATAPTHTSSAAPAQASAPTAAAAAAAAAVVVAQKTAAVDKHALAQQRREALEAQRAADPGGSSARGATVCQRRRKQDGAALVSEASKPTVYSNVMATDSGEPDQQNAATRKAMAAADLQLKAFHLGLKETLDEYRVRAARLDRKCEQVATGEDRFERGAERLCDRLANFDSSVAREVQRLQAQVHAKDFARPEALASMFANMKLENRHFMRNLRIMETRVRTVRGFLSLERLLEARWSSELLARLRELVRRAPGGHLPPSSLLFVSVVLDVVQHGWRLDQSVFFRILEAVVQREDHVLSAVHRVVTCVRDVVGLPAEQFLRWLEAREIPASPELTALIRAARKKRRAAKYNTSTTRSQAMAIAALRPIGEDETQSLGEGDQDSVGSSSPSPLSSPFHRARDAASVRSASMSELEELETSDDGASPSRLSTPVTTRPPSREA